MSSSPESWEYADYIVGFLDVLGMSDMVDQSQQDPTLRIKVGGLLKELNQIVLHRNKGLSRESHVRLNSFSDSIMISCPTISEQSFRLVLWIICEFFVKSIVRHCFLRGALTVGPHWENERAFFGPVFIKAYEMERSLALWPRCIIDPIALSRPDICPQGSWKERFQYILKGSDGLPYLDYLGYSFSTALGWMLDEQDTQPEKRIKNPDQLFITILKSHKTAICEEIEQAKQDYTRKMLLLSKYYPLAKYHNTVIQRITRGTPKSADLDSISPGSLIGRLINGFNIMATKAGLDSKRIEEAKRRFVADIVESRIAWRNQLIDVGRIFQDV